MARARAIELPKLRPALAASALLVVAGCMDVDAEITVLDANTARVMTTATMTDDIFTLLAAQSGRSADLGMLCAAAPPVRDNGRVSCTSVAESGFADLTFPGLETSLVAIAALAASATGAPRVRVALSTAALRQAAALRAGGLVAPQPGALTDALFAGHAFTFSVTGGTVHATNMDRMEGGTSAGVSIPLDVLFSPAPGLPPTLYATIELTEPSP